MKKEKAKEVFQIEELDDAALAAASSGVGEPINNQCNTVAGCGAPLNGVCGASS